MKKLNDVFIITSLIILLSGCGKLNLQSYTEVSPSGSGDFSFQFVYDDVIAGQCKNGFLTDKKNIPKEDLVRKYKKGTDKIEEYKVHFKSIDELNRKTAAEQDDFAVKIKENKGITKTTYTYEMNFKKPINSDSFRAYLTGQDSVAAMNQDKNSIETFLKEVSFINAVKLPGKIISTNAPETKDNYVVWNYYLNQITPETVMTATYEVENKTNKAMIEVLFVVIGIVLIYVTYRRFKPRVS